MRKVFYCILLNLFVTNIFAQQLVVECFAPQINPKQVTERDFNDELCAEVHIYSVDNIIKVEGNVVGEPNKYKNEAIVFLTAGTKEISILSEGHLPIAVHFDKLLGRALKQGESFDLMLTNYYNDISIETPINELNISKEVRDLINNTESSGRAYYAFYDLFLNGLNGNPDINIEQDPKLAMYFARKSACLNWFLGCQTLADEYRYGTIITQNPERCFFWCKRTALVDDSDYMLGITSVAECYKDGFGVKQDYSKAVELLKISSEKNYSAQFLLGYMYHEGLGVQKDYQKAFELTQKSADAGFAKAEFNLAMFYAKGEGVIKDLDKFKFWILKAADDGDSTAA